MSKIVYACMNKGARDNDVPSVASHGDSFPAYMSNVQKTYMHK